MIDPRLIDRGGVSGRVGPAGPWAHATGLDRNELGALLIAAGLGRRRNTR